MRARKYRFFFHYYKQLKMMSVHFRGDCYICKHIDCRVPVETKWNKRQPQIVMQGFATEISINWSANKIIIS